MRVEDVEIMALRRLPKIVESIPGDDDNEASDYGDTVVNENSDNDSAIYLDRGFDCLQLSKDGTRFRHLQRSVSDVG